MTDDSLTQLGAQLQHARLFQGVRFDQLAAELSESRLCTVDESQVLLDPKHLNTEIFIVLEGELMVCLEPRLGNPLVRLGPGACVGELSIIDTSPPSAYVIASIATRLLAISKAVLWRMLASQQVMALNLLHILTQRIRENNVLLLGSMELQRQYRNKAETDTLTGLHNRVWFEEVFPKQLELCERTGQFASILMLDIDHFKLINDQYGHPVGDEALRHLGRLLRHNLRATDLCARYGGEEMIVLMPGADLTHALHTAERLRQSIADARLVLADGVSLQMHVSGGLAQWIAGTRLIDVIRSADHALYRAKAQGRNQIVASPIPAGF